MWGGVGYSQQVQCKMISEAFIQLIIPEIYQALYRPTIPINQSINQSTHQSGQ
jgi:hypothetical protein